MRPQGNYIEDAKSARRSLCGMRQERRGAPLGDDAYRAATHLKTGFGGVRLGRLDVCIAFSSGLASGLACELD
jgi:hypothetical protein